MHTVNGLAIVRGEGLRDRRVRGNDSEAKGGTINIYPNLSKITVVIVWIMDLT